MTPYRDEQAFAAAVLRLLGDQAAARRMGAAARDFCRERFSMDRCVAEHLQLFRDALGRRDRQTCATSRVSGEGSG